MSKSLTNYMAASSLPAISDADMADALDEGLSDVGSGGGGQTYLSFSGKSGRYALGKNKAEPADDQLFIMEPHAYTEGWVCWKNKAVVGRERWSFYNRKTEFIKEADLKEYGPYRENSGDGWSAEYGLGLISTDGENEMINFALSSKSGVNVFHDLMDEVKKRMRMQEPSMPVFTLEVEEFEAQQQTNYKPVFKIDAWVTREAVASYFAEELSLSDLRLGKKGTAKKAVTNRGK